MTIRHLAKYFFNGFNQIVDWINMGNTIDKCKTIVFVSRPREIISEKSLRAIFEISEFLKLNVQNRNIFRDTGYRRRVRQIATYIGTGNEGLHNFLIERNPVEAAAALQYYLVRLPEPLLPKYVQDLALETDENVQPEVVAEDILGLIRQDLKGRRLVLIFMLLDLLCFLRKHAISDELSGSNIPVALLPVFFTLQPHHLQKWRSIANIFMEMIDLSPEIFILPPGYRSTSESASVSNTSETIRFEDFDFGRHLQDDVVVHRIVTRIGSEGDANFPEIVQRFQRRNLPNMLNPIFGFYRTRFR